MEILTKINNNIYMVGLTEYITKEAYDMYDFSSLGDIRVMVPNMSSDELVRLNKHIDSYGQ
jgi:hypothetical protein